MIIINEKQVENGVCFIDFLVSKHFSVTFSNLGASIFDIIFSDRFNNCESIVLRPADPFTWMHQRTFAGSVVGPLAGRYDPKQTPLERNRPPLHFHGGSQGYDKQLWDYNIQQTEHQAIIIFSFQDNENDLFTTVTYQVSSYGQLDMTIQSKTNSRAYFNPTNHIYFNLNGNPYQPIDNHQLYLNAKVYCHENAQKLITATQPIIEGSFLDFSSEQGKSLGGIKNNGGLDTTFIFENKREGCILQPENGRAVRITTTLPAAVIFTFNNEQPFFTRDNQPYPKYAGITFETQYPANHLALCQLTTKQSYYAKTSFSFFHT